MPTVGQGLIQGFAARLRYPQLFFVAAGLFLADLIIPDLIPFADEILLGLVTVFLGRMRKPRDERDAPPPVKDVTPRAGG